MLKRNWNLSCKLPEYYKNTMPDLQNSNYQSVFRINQVGCHNFRVPLIIPARDGTTQETIASVTGTVSLEANKKGINMSRIIRVFASENQNTGFLIDKLCNILVSYKKILDSLEAHISISFPYRLWQPALSTESQGGWKFYDINFDIDLNRDGNFRKVLSVKFVYSSACPCSDALSIHAGEVLGVYGIPHSQRSVMNIQIEFGHNNIWIEDIINAVRNALITETQTFVKREDEAYFALLNGSHTKFVEDAVRVVADKLNTNSELAEKIIDFRLVALHMESLHDHDAVAVLLRGIPGTKFCSFASASELALLKC